MDNTNIHSERVEEHWNDMELTPFIRITEAETEEDACQKIAEQYRYDIRFLLATKIN